MHVQARTNRQKTFPYNSHNDKKYNNGSQIYKSRKFHGLKEKPGLSLIITRYSENFLNTTEKAKAGLQKRLRMSMSNIFLVKLIKTDHYQPKIFER